MKTYKLFIQEYNITKNDYITREKIVKTNDIYHEIGKIYCQSFVKIKRIDYLDITKDLEQENERLNNIINELEKYLKKRKKKLNTNDDFDRYAKLEIQDILDKIKELKGE